MAPTIFKSYMLTKINLGGPHETLKTRIYIYSVQFADNQVVVA
jgi:hypothetical protein